MGVVFFAAAVLALLLGGMGLSIMGVILRVALKKRARAGGRWARRIRRLTVPAIILGVSCMIVPLGFFGFAAYENASTPDDFVETGILIEENGYQLEEFTAGGTVWQRLPFNAVSQHGEPVFTYKEDGWYTASRWGNYYHMENGIGCDLVSDRYSGLFCPADQYDRVIAAYESAREMDSIWRVNIGNEIEVTDGLKAAFRAVQALEAEGREMGKDDYENIDFQLISEDSFDDVVSYGSFLLLYLTDGVYLQHIEQDQNGVPHIYAVPIPEEHQSVLLELNDSIPFP